MNKTIYVRDAAGWRRAQDRALADGVSLSQVIEFALARYVEDTRRNGWPMAATRQRIPNPHEDGCKPGCACGRY